MGDEHGFQVEDEERDDGRRRGTGKGKAPPSLESPGDEAAAKARAGAAR